jgi:hypothetical protein
MNREDFAAFVARTLDDVIHLAEEKCGKELPRKIAFRWLGSSHPIVSENIVDHIVERVFVDEEHIYPCVDMAKMAGKKYKWSPDGALAYITPDMAKPR